MHATIDDTLGSKELASQFHPHDGADGNTLRTKNAVPVLPGAAYHSIRKDKRV